MWVSDTASTLGQRQTAMSNNIKRDAIKRWKTDISTVYCGEWLGARTVQKAIRWQNFLGKKRLQWHQWKKLATDNRVDDISAMMKLVVLLFQRSVWSSIVALYIWPLKLNIIADRLVLACGPCLADQWSRRQLSGYVVLFMSKGDEGRLSHRWKRCVKKKIRFWLHLIKPCGDLSECATQLIEQYRDYTIKISAELFLGNQLEHFSWSAIKGGKKGLLQLK